MMMIVDRTAYRTTQHLEVQRLLSQQTLAAGPAGQCAALCMSDPFELICTVMYMRDKGGSVLLLPQQTPFETALGLARQAGCQHFIYGRLADVIELPEGDYYASQPCVLQFSSGTTGDPKLISRTWTEIDTELQGYNQALNADSDEQPIIWVPVTHSFGLLTGVFASLMRGAEPIVLTGKNPRFWDRMLQEHAKHLVYAVPYLLHLYLSIKPAVRMHRVVTSGSPLTDPLLQQLQDVSQEVIQQYGCSELGCVSVARRPHSASDVGQLLPHLELKTPGRMEEPAEWVISNGSIELQTRDLGYRDGNGRMHLLGRLDDLINVSGQKVIPSEVEQILLRHPGVREAVVFRGQHPVWGESVRAIIVPDGEPDEDAVRQWCMRQLPPYKIPSSYIWAASIPRNDNGKISRKLLAMSNL